MAQLSQYPISLLWPPVVAFIVAVVGAAYLILIGPKSGKRYGGAATWGETAYFFGGLFLYWVAWGSPIHVIGEAYLMMAHMVTMILATIFAPLFLVLGLPQSVVDWALGFPTVRRIAGLLTKPILTMVVLTLTLFVWHSPSIFDRAITTEWIHYTQYATVLFAGLVFWWPLVTRSQVLPRMRPLAMLGYTFGTIVLQTVLFGPLMIMMLDEPLYQIYVHAPRLINISPVEDQQFGHMLFMVVSPATLLIYFTKAISELIRESGAPTRASTPKP